MFGININSAWEHEARLSAADIHIQASRRMLRARALTHHKNVIK